MEKFLGDIGTEKADCLSALWDMGSHIPVFQRRDGFDLFLYCYESGFSNHKSS